MGAERVRITEVELGSPVLTSEDEYSMNMLAISAIPSGGSRLAWLAGDGQVHVAQLDANDQLTGTPFSLPGRDFSDIHADDSGGVVLMTRGARGGGDRGCGDINHLCGNAASYPADYSCYDMYLVRFDGAAETWATQLTDSSEVATACDTWRRCTAERVVGRFAVLVVRSRGGHRELVGDGVFERLAAAEGSIRNAIASRRCVTRGIQRDCCIGKHPRVEHAFVARVSLRSAVQLREACASVQPPARVALEGPRIPPPHRLRAARKADQQQHPRNPTNPTPHPRQSSAAGLDTQGGLPWQKRHRHAHHGLSRARPR